MSGFTARIARLAVIFGATAALVTGVTANASAQVKSPEEVRSAQSAFGTVGTYRVEKVTDHGFVTDASTVLAQVSSGAGQATLGITGSYSVTKSATLTTGIGVSGVSFGLGYTRSVTVSVSVNCSFNTGGLPARVTAYPREHLITYALYQYNRLLGYGSFTRPVGIYCKLTRP